VRPVVGAAALALATLFACAAPTPPTPTPPTPTPRSTPTVLLTPIATAVSGAGTPIAAAPTVAPCAASTPTTEHLPAPFLTPVGRDPVGVAWTGYRSPDRLIWVSDLPTHAGGDHKVLWLKPPGSVLRVTGRRLDGAAPPMTVRIPEGYGGDFQASAVGFPTPGCWEVEARADASRLRIVVAVGG
jgi:hypothetical protein